MIIEAPVAGVVVRVLVNPGEYVAIDQEVIVIEAMKMELPIPSEISGTVDSVLVAVNQPVHEGQALISLK